MVAIKTLIFNEKFATEALLKWINLIANMTKCEFRE